MSGEGGGGGSGGWGGGGGGGGDRVKIEISNNITSEHGQVCLCIPCLTGD